MSIYLQEHIARMDARITPFSERVMYSGDEIDYWEISFRMNTGGARVQVIKEVVAIDNPCCVYCKTSRVANELCRTCGSSPDKFG